MPELSKDLVAMLTYLLPGFLVAWLFYALTSHQKPAQLERVIQALIFTLLVSALVILEREALLFAGRWLVLRPWDKDADLLASVTTAAGLGLALAYFTNTDSLHEWLRQKNLSNRSSHPSEWCTVFAMQQTFIVVEYKDGRRLYGWPKVWPSNFEHGHMYITDPSWIHQEPHVPLPNNDGILVAVGDIASIEFLKRQESQS